MDVVVLRCRKNLPGIHDGEVEGAILKLRKVKSQTAALVLAIGEDEERLFAAKLT